MLNLGHKNPNVWKLSMNLISEIYKLTKSYPKDELYNLTSQMRRASVSISSNIAEGASRKSSLERKRFYEISRSSLIELDTQLEISLRLNYISESFINELGDLVNHIFAMLTKLINKTNLITFAICRLTFAIYR
jgi:four helix bundle protein